jgi:hypothetical protein
LSETGPVLGLSHLRGYATEGFRRKLAAACAAHAKW